jgi:ATPase subunit of ABC transporter with duplicated ATPase domains
MRLRPQIEPEPDSSGRQEWLLDVKALVAGWSRPIVGPVSLRLAPGEIVGLWGANGSGKSTLLSAIAGGARCFAGRVRRLPGLKVAVLPQAPVRFSPLPVTGRELLSIAGVVTSSGRGASDLPDSLARLLPQRLDRVSGGQHQLLSVWAALAGRGRLVLLDEPTNNLDPTHEALLGEFLAARAADRAVLLVSHERDFLAAHCTRVVELVSAADRDQGLPVLLPARVAVDGSVHPH